MFSSECRPKKPIWHNQVPGGYPLRDALAVPREAAAQCRDRDVRTEDVLSALAFLGERATRPYIFSRFLQALRVEDAEIRSTAARNAYNGMERYFSSGHESLRSPASKPFGD